MEVNRLAEQRLTAIGIVPDVRAALESADLDAISKLLDPNVRWGPDDSDQACQNRQQVLAWYRRARAAGVRAHVTETTVYGDRILVGLAVTGRPVADGAGTEADRWQVLTVGGSGIVEICGFDSREEAAARATIGLAR
jgi:SnoaL-like domain